MGKLAVSTVIGLILIGSPAVAQVTIRAAPTASDRLTVFDENHDPIGEIGKDELNAMVTAHVVSQATNGDLGIRWNERIGYLRQRDLLVEGEPTGPMTRGFAIARPGAILGGLMGSRVGAGSSGGLRYDLPLCPDDPRCTSLEAQP